MQKSILDDIVTSKRREIDAAKMARPETPLRAAAEAAARCAVFSKRWRRLVRSS